MASIPEFDDTGFPEASDDEFDELNELSEHGTFWAPRDPEKDHPHKLVLKAVRWEQVTSKYDATKERNIVVGKTKSGETWKVPADNLDLESLYTGEIKKWNGGVLEVVGNQGPLRVGEVFAVEYTGDRSYTNQRNQQVTVGRYRFTRKPPDRPVDAEQTHDEPEPKSPSKAEVAEGDDSDIPF